MTTPVDRFGQYLVQHVHDAAIEEFDRTASGHWKTDRHQYLCKVLGQLTPEQQTVVRECVMRAAGVSLCQFAGALTESFDFDEGIAVVVDGVNVAEEADKKESLKYEPYGLEGWVARYSKYPELWQKT